MLIPWRSNLGIESSHILTSFPARLSATVLGLGYPRAGRGRVEEAKTHLKALFAFAELFLGTVLQKQDVIKLVWTIQILCHFLLGGEDENFQPQQELS